MSQYVTKALKKYKYPTPIRPQYAPYCWTQPAYGQKIQFAPSQKKNCLMKMEKHAPNQLLVHSYIMVEL